MGKKGDVDQLQKEGGKDRQREGERDPVGGNLSSCSGYAWSAKRSCHLIVSFSTEALCGPAASERRGGQEERGKDPP